GDLTGEDVAAGRDEEDVVEREAFPGEALPHAAHVRRSVPGRDRRARDASGAPPAGYARPWSQRAVRSGALGADARRGDDAPPPRAPRTPGPRSRRAGSERSARTTPRRSSAWRGAERRHPGGSRQQPTLPRASSRRGFASAPIKGMRAPSAVSAMISVSSSD